MTTNFFSPMSFIAVFGSGIRDGWVKIRIRDKHPGSATLFITEIFSGLSAPWEQLFSWLAAGVSWRPSLSACSTAAVSRSSRPSSSTVSPLTSSTSNIAIIQYFPVFRIHDILVWIRIRIRGSMPLTNGSGFGSGTWIRKKFGPIFKEL
jgi:hypothetical protein